MMCWRFFSVYLIAPWFKARFYSAWVYYQKTDVYRQRLTCLGFSYAAYEFVNSREWRYYLKGRLSVEPNLRFRLLFLPWTIEKPPILETAKKSGCFEQWPFKTQQA